MIVPLFLLLSGVVKALFTPRISLPPLCRGLGGLEGGSQRSLQRNGIIRKTLSGGMAAMRRHSQCISVKLQAVSKTSYTGAVGARGSACLSNCRPPLCRMLWWTWSVEPGPCSCSASTQRATAGTSTCPRSESSCAPRRSCGPCSSTAQVRPLALPQRVTVPHFAANLWHPALRLLWVELFNHTHKDKREDWKWNKSSNLERVLQNHLKWDYMHSHLCLRFINTAQKVFIKTILTFTTYNIIHVWETSTHYSCWPL